MADKNIKEKPLRPKQTLRRMALRNLKIALALRPRLVQLKEELGYTPQMSPEEYTIWKESKAGKITEDVIKLLKDVNLPIDQSLFINWLFEASEADIAELKDYCKNPKGVPPESYYLLYSPAYESLSPRGLGWDEEIGYRVAVVTWEKNIYWRMWGDVRDVPEEAVWSFLQKSGDFVIKGNLDIFDVNSWRRIGNVLSGLKQKKGFGEKLGLVPGGYKGYSKTQKHILGNLTWGDIQNAVLQDPPKYDTLRSEYIDYRIKGYLEEYGNIPPEEEQEKERRRAMKSFQNHIKRIPK